MASCGPPTQAGTNEATKGKCNGVRNPSTSIMAGAAWMASSHFFGPSPCPLDAMVGGGASLDSEA